MNSGLYGCFRLDGGPVDAQACKALGLAPTADPTLSGLALSGVALGVDRVDPNAVSLVTAGADLCILLGYLDEAEALARELGLAVETPAAALAHAAYRRFGEDTPAHLVGEWSCLIWRPSERQLCLMTSRAIRDPVLFAVRANQVVVAPSIHQLRGVAWIGRDLDPEGFLARVSTFRARRELDSPTLLRGVEMLGPGRCLTIRADGSACHRVADLPVDAAWQGSFEEAVRASEALLRRVIRQRLARRPRAALFLSGGLDSSLLCWLAASERGAGQTIEFFTSAAPEGSGLQDETEFAALVADRLGVRLHRVAPPAEANVYRPSERHFLSVNEPARTTWHYLYEAFLAACMAADLPFLIDGANGEYTVSAQAPLATPTFRARGWLRGARTRLRGASGPQWPVDAFHGRLSPSLLARASQTMEANWRRPMPADHPFEARRPWGYRMGVDRLVLHTTQRLGGDVRADAPFRDERLLRLYSGFPGAFSAWRGVPRAPVRAMLRGNVPDVIVTRPKGIPFCPDFRQRMRRQSGEALARLPAFRKTGLGDWVDVDWLEVQLQLIGAAETLTIPHAFRVQMTANLAEFLMWWMGEDQR